ncbi:homocysteine S-methyltransferase family protein [Ensifer sesbaniae]
MAYRPRASTSSSTRSSCGTGVHANAFASEEEGAANETLHWTRHDLSADNYSRFACGWMESGATIIGGCRGIGASHIRCVPSRLIAAKKSRPHRVTE